ncbi:MAG: septum formation initiator family protein [Clostridia bacterium]|nr:septum formation initiator family protein [Clostridia bacterium]
MKKQSNKKVRIAIISVIAVFAVIMTAWIGTLISDNIKLNKELGEKEDELAAWQEENAALDALVDEENETALMEEYARKSGYVYPDERVYINGN